MYKVIPEIQMCAAGLQQAVQALLGALLVVSVSRWAVFVGVLLQDSDYIMVAKVHRFFHWRVPPSVRIKPKICCYYHRNVCVISFMI